MVGSSEKSVKLPEKSCFSETCSLLSQYLKGRGSFGDLLSLGSSCNNIEANGIHEIQRRPAAKTMNLFPMISNSGDVSMNLFPQQIGFAPKNGTPNTVDSSLHKPPPAAAADVAAVEPQKAQMTIFYGGQVIVLNDFLADKADEILQLASKGISQSQSQIESGPPVVTPSLPKNPTEPNYSLPPISNSVTNFSNNLIPERALQEPPSRPVACDLPIARRNSLHRFLEKRKDRIVARAPYQVSSSAGAPNNPAESKTWLGLTAQTSQ